MATKKTTSKTAKKAVPATKQSVKKAPAATSRSSKPVVPPKPAKKSAAPAKKQVKTAPKKAAPKPPAKPLKAKKPVVPPKPKAPAKKTAAAKPIAKKTASKSAPISKKMDKPAPKPAAKPKAKPVVKTVAKSTAKPAPKAVQTAKPISKPAPKAQTPPPQKSAAPVKKQVKPAAPAPKTKPAPRVEAVPRPLPPPPPVPRQSLKAKPLTRAELAAFRKALQEQLDLKQENLKTLTGNNLGQSLAESAGDISTHSTHMADHGTDNFARDLALTLAGNRCDDVREIEEAIRRIDQNRYGYCELCDKPIGRERLRAHPFARCCILCQSLAEQGKPRGIRFAGPPTIMPPHQDTDATESPTDPDQSDSAV
jgi:RNA polymerase-binding transcription factor DksA